MKAIIRNLFIGAAFISASFSLTAQNDKVISLNGARFTETIVNQWIKEYKQENPHSTLSFKVDNNNPNADIQLVAHQSVGNVGNTYYVGRYALLPVSNRNNPLLKKVSRKGFSKKDLKKIVFIEDFLDDEEYVDEEEEDSKFDVTVYSRDNSSSISITIANYFETEAVKIKGKKIVGDDIYVLAAVKRDNKGIAFGSLNHIYDINSRKLASEIVVLPLNLKSQQKEYLNAENIDKTIELLEKTNNIESIPVEKFGFSLSEQVVADQEVSRFIGWILTSGQAYNNQLGFLKIENSSAVASK